MNIEKAIQETMDAYFKDMSYQGILNKAHEILNNPIMLLDKSFSCLYHLPKEPIDNIEWMKITTDGYADAQFIKQVEQNISRFLKNDTHDGQYFQSQSASGKYFSRLVTDVSRNKDILGGIEVLEYNHPFEPNTDKYVAFLGDLLYVELQREKVQNGSFGCVEEAILEDAFSSNSSIEAFNIRINKQNLFKDNESYLIATMLIPPAKLYTANTIHTTIELPIDDVYIIDNNETISFLFHSKELSLPKISETIVKISKEYDSFVVYSSPFNNISEILPLYQKSKEIVSKPYFNQSKNVFHISHCVIDDLLITTTITNDFIEKQLVPIQTLTHYDELHDTNLCQTLLIYLTCFTDMNAAATKLFIHRNTLTYRIDKIKQITGYTFETPEECFDILILLKIYVAKVFNNK